MQLKPFLLDAWLDQYEHDIEFNLAASTGPTWTVNDILALADEETRAGLAAAAPSALDPPLPSADAPAYLDHGTGAERMVTVGAWGPT